MHAESEDLPTETWNEFSRECIAPRSSIGADPRAKSVEVHLFAITPFFCDPALHLYLEVGVLICLESFIIPLL